MRSNSISDVGSTPTHLLSATDVSTWAVIDPARSDILAYPVKLCRPIFLKLIQILHGTFLGRSQKFGTIKTNIFDKLHCPIVMKLVGYIEIDSYSLLSKFGNIPTLLERSYSRSKCFILAHAQAAIIVRF